MRTREERTERQSATNLFRWQSVSEAENCRKQAVIDVFCSMSIDKSRKDSSREDVCRNQ